MNEEKLKEWSKMDETEKIKWNGFDGFCKGITFRESSAFKNKWKRKI